MSYPAWLPSHPSHPSFFFPASYECVGYRTGLSNSFAYLDCIADALLGPKCLTWSSTECKSLFAKRWLWSISCCAPSSWPLLEGRSLSGRGKIRSLYPFEQLPRPSVGLKIIIVVEKCKYLSTSIFVTCFLSKKLIVFPRNLSLLTAGASILHDHRLACCPITKEILLA